jgi:hypothetical protein
MDHPIMMLQEVMDSLDKELSMQDNASQGQEVIGANLIQYSPISIQSQI